MSNVNGKVILVTGGGQGLGAAICRVLAKNGATVIAGDIKKDNIDKLVTEIQQNNGKAEAVLLDVTDSNNVQNVVQQLVDKYGHIDAVVNNAGVDYTKSIEEFSYNEWNHVINVNLSGPFNVSKAVYPFMKKQHKGHIVNIASTAAKRAWPNAAAYHASKWGLLGFSHALHTEARQEGIKVTALVAGGMQTPFLLERFPDLDRNLLQDPQNVAETILYVLCQPDETVIPEVTVLPMRETSWP
jgi:NADP-dependent 3-hydroxy acid dehydrogenase YdfG